MQLMRWLEGATGKLLGFLPVREDSELAAFVLLQLSHWLPSTARGGDAELVHSYCDFFMSPCASIAQNTPLLDLVCDLL